MLVRRVDELGRIVIPKDIRKSIDIEEGERLEVTLNEKEEIILKKKDTFKDILEEIRSLAKSLSQFVSSGFVICSLSKIIASKKDYISYVGKNISKELSLFIRKREKILLEKTQVPLINEDSKSTKYQYINPIVYEGDAIGALILKSDSIKEYEMKLIEFATKIIENGVNL